MPRTTASLRLNALAVLAIGCMALLGFRLWQLQVVEHEKYASRIQGASEVTVRIPSVRGEIRDRNGITLVRNRASYEVDFFLPEVVAGFRPEYEKESSKLPVRETETTTRRGMKRLQPYADIVKIVHERIIPTFEELQLDDDLSFNAEDLRRHYRQEDQIPWTYRKDIDFPTMATLLEHSHGLPGVTVTVRPVREYVYGAVAAHLLGSVGSPNDIRNEPDIRDYNYYEEDIVGVSQIEKSMDSFLRGKPGRRIMRKNVKGVIESQVGLVEPTQGDNVQLTIDARIQTIAEKTMRQIGRGAAIVVDPRNGDILAMVSVPSFDPNIFVPRISRENWAAIRDDETNPLLNRAISHFAPGSTYKVFVALAGLRKGFQPSKTYHCPGSLTYGNRMMKCWSYSKGGLGTQNLVGALKFSSNTYFFQWANAAGIQAIEELGELLGLGRPTGIELDGEAPGILPGPDWLRAHSPREIWSKAYTANVAIGQGLVLATPLQMAMITATIANGGTSYYPRLIDQVVDQQGRVVYRPEPRVRCQLLENGLTTEQIEAVRTGMREVVNGQGGTASRAKLKNIIVSGKTGTAEFFRSGKKENHAWFISFAPYDDPKLAVCVLVQNAKAGGRVAATLAARIIEETLALDRGMPVEIARLDPAPGNTRFIESIDFSSDVPTQYAAGNAEGAEPSDEGHQETVDPRLAQVRPARVAVPDIEPETDEQGRVIPRAKPVPKKRSLLESFFRPGSRGDNPSSGRGYAPPSRPPKR